MHLKPGELDSFPINSYITPVETQDGSFTLYNHNFKETYHSHGGALKEAKELYIQSSQITFSNDPGYVKHRSIAVLDIGLGLGYNAMTTIDLWLKTKDAVALQLVSLENDLELFKMLCTANAPWQTTWPQIWLDLVSLIKKSSHNENCFSLKFNHPLSFTLLTWTIWIDDAAKAVKQLSGIQFDYIWHDAFSPSKCPSLWSVEWFRSLILLCRLDTKLYTYSVARKTKTNLELAGWQYRKIPAFENKRSWLEASPFQKH